MEMTGLVGGEDGFDEFFVSFSPRVLLVTERLTGIRVEAEDVTAEAFARAFARWRKVGALPYREAWVLRVASNLAIDLARRNSRHQPPVRRPEFADPADLVALRTTLVHALAA